MSLSYQDLCAFLYREARHLDDREWDEWLAMYDESCTFWMPAWDDDGELTEDPQSEISLIWYGRRAGLEDRVFRIGTGKAASATPMPRTCHMINNVLVETLADGNVEARVVWQTLYNRQGVEGCFYGHATYLLRRVGDGFRIRKQHTVLLNDKIDSVLDFYHV